MKNIKQLFILFAFVALPQILFAQDFEVPKNYKLKKSEDFTKYEKDVIDCVNWLEKTPVNEEPDKRQEASTFLLSWITGSPNVTVELRSFVVKLIDKNADLLLIFMGGWTKFVLENPDQKNDMLSCNMAGLKSLIKVYQMGNGIKKDKNVDKIIKLDDSGKLEKWVQEQLKK